MPVRGIQWRRLRIQNMIWFLLVALQEDELKPWVHNIDYSNPDLGTFTSYYREVLDHYKPGGPIILKIGAESPSLSSGRGEFVEVIAKKFNGAIFALQHRFFGISHPFENTTVESLKYLTVDQAIHDLAAFRTYMENVMENEHGAPSNTKWLLVGGSYPGLLSAYTRKEFPDLFAGAISSSGVVKAIQDFQDFDIQDAISMGHQCAQVARNARRRIDEILDSGNEKEIEFLLQQFKATGMEPEIFRYVVGEMYTLYLQYGDVREICNILESTLYTGESAVAALARFCRDYFIPNKCDGNILTYSNKYMKNAIAGPESGPRCWLWMTCNELAYWQTSPGRLGLRSPKLNVEFFHQQCKDVFYDDMPLPDTEGFNKKYGGLGVQTTNVYFTTSAQDPWTWACVTKESGVAPGNYAHTINGPEMGHCSDLHGARPTDSEDLKKTRAHMLAVIEEWLA